MSARSDEVRAALAEAVARRDSCVPKDAGDPAVARLGGAALRQHHAGTDAALRRYVEADAAVDALTMRLARSEADEKEAARVRLTRRDVVGATAVRDRFGWHRVVRVNARTVTVATPYSWTERIEIDAVLQVSS
jgi:alkylated DNA nucleotide flippase Atl1